MLALKKLISPQEESESFFPSPFCVETFSLQLQPHLIYVLNISSVFVFEEKLIELISGSTQ